MKALLWFVAVALGGCHSVFELTEVQLPATADASTGDAFVPGLHCPIGYTTELADGGSRYRVITKSQRPGLSYLECAADSDARYTHLAVFETLDEQVAVQELLDDGNDDVWYVGAVQLPGQTSPRAGWVWLTGEPIGVGAFDPTAPSGGEPNDNDGIENGHEDVAYIRDGQDGLVDVYPTLEAGALCECDGRPMDDAASSAYMTSG